MKRCRWFKRRLGGRTLVIIAVLARRAPILALERPIEGRLRFVSDIGGDVRDTSRCLFERPCGHLKSPTRQVRHWRLRQISSEPLHESRPRNSHFVCEIGDRPRLGNAAVEQSKALPHEGIARSREPACLLLRQSGSRTAVEYQRTEPPRAWPAW